MPCLFFGYCESKGLDCGRDLSDFDPLADEEGCDNLYIRKRNLNCKFALILLHESLWNVHFPSQCRERYDVPPLTDI